MGVRFTSLRRPRRFTSRASSEGAATPVTESEEDGVDVARARGPRAASASRIARSPSSSPQRM